jgi:HD-GYP domain-containing protein (c-di-GMP phosphodiesterase class II)
MEEDSSGLKIIDYIRNSMKNNFVRIIIRTSQPGQAPEKKVNIDYDINDYKEMAELTSQKLYSTIITSLRSYDNIMQLEKNRRFLGKIIEISGNLYSYRKFHDFAIDMIKYIFEVKSILNQNNKVKNGFISMNLNNLDFIVYSAVGKYSKHVNEKIDKLLFSTISSAFNNLCLSNDIVNTQSELLITLGRVVETRSKETGNHVRRVAEYSKLLALK